MRRNNYRASYNFCNLIIHRLSYVNVKSDSYESIMLCFLTNAKEPVNWSSQIEVNIVHQNVVMLAFWPHLQKGHLLRATEVCISNGQYFPPRGVINWLPVFIDVIEVFDSYPINGAQLQFEIYSIYIYSSNP